MKTSTKITLGAIAIGLLILIVKAVPVWERVEAVKAPRYETGEHQSAKFCAGCHQDIYRQWSQNSRHALAHGKSFRDFKDKFTSKFMLKTMMGEDLCYACHGSKKVNEGVNCTTCHGTVIPDATITETHDRKFKPGRKDLKKPDFCAKCHVMQTPIMGSYIMDIYGEWQKSDAARKGVTCQGCHMNPRENKRRYHGFDTAIRNIDIYRDDLRVTDVALEFPYLNMAIENVAAGHAIPAGGPTRILVLKITLLDKKGEMAYETVESFGKKADLMFGVMPYRISENTQLQAGETRKLTFTLPASLAGRIDRARMTLRFYEISDEHLGDLKKAHWISEPFLEENVDL